MTTSQTFGEDGGGVNSKKFTEEKSSSTKKPKRQGQESWNTRVDKGALVSLATAAPEKKQEANRKSLETLLAKSDELGAKVKEGLSAQNGRRKICNVAGAIISYKIK